MADQYSQGLKYGGGPAEIQRDLKAWSERFRLLEEQQELISDRLKTVKEHTGSSLPGFVDIQPRTAEIVQGIRWAGKWEDLNRQKERELDEIAHEILKVKQKRKPK